MNCSSIIELTLLSISQAGQPRPENTGNMKTDNCYRKKYLLYSAKVEVVTVVNNEAMMSTLAKGTNQMSYFYKE